MSDPITPAPAPTGDPAPAPVEWTAGLNDDLKGYVQNKGFKDPAAVLDSYRNLEKLHGVPKERLLKLPEKDDDPEWNAVMERLGKPKEAKEYDIKVPENLGDDKFADWARNSFHELGLSKKQGEKLAAKWNEYIGNTLSARDQEYRQSLAQQDNGLKTKWGQAYDQNIQVAKVAAEKFGVTKEQIDVMEKAMGFAGVMEFMHNLGSKIGEHNFVDGKKGSQGLLTPEGAQSEINRLKMDRGFAGKLAAGDAESVKKWSDLHMQAYPGT